MDKKYLKYFTLNVAIEPPRMVIDLKEVIMSYLNDEVSTQLTQTDQTDQVEITETAETAEIAETVEEFTEIEEFTEVEEISPELELIAKNRVIDRLVNSLESGKKEIDNTDPDRADDEEFNGMVDSLIENIRNESDEIREHLDILTLFEIKSYTSNDNLFTDNMLLVDQITRDDKIIELNNMLENFQEFMQDLNFDAQTITNITNDLKKCT